MGNCLQTCLIRKEAPRSSTPCTESAIGKEVLDQQPRFHGVHVEDVLLKNRHDGNGSEKMGRDHAVVLEQGKKKMGKRVRFSEEVEDIRSKEEMAEDAARCGGKGEGSTALRVRIKLRKGEAAMVIGMLEAGGGRRPLEELIGELGTFVSSHETKTCGQEERTPVLASIPFDESV